MKFGYGFGLNQPRSAIAPKPTLPVVSASPNLVYGTTRMMSGYTGAALRVRRASDNAEQDIGFASTGDIDTAALAAFRGASELFVTTWYDQSGNGYNATQTTAANQPRIRSENFWRGSACVLFDGFAATSGGTQILKSLNFPAGLSVDRRAHTALLGQCSRATNSNALVEHGTTTSRILIYNDTPDLVIHFGTGATPQQVIPAVTVINRASPCIVGTRGSGTGFDIYADERTHNAAAAPTGTVSGGFIGGSATGAWFNGRFEVFCYVTYPASLSNTDRDTVREAMRQMHPVLRTSDLTNHLVIEGDSISEGTSDTYLFNTARYIYRDLPKSIAMTNLAVHGTNASTIYSNRTSKVGAAYRSGVNNILLAAPGCNDINQSVTGANLWANSVLPLVQYAQTTGYARVILGTVIPRSGFTTAQENERLAYNTLVRNNAATYNYTVADYCALPEFDVQADASNTEFYYTDGIHPVSAGYAKMAALARPLVEALLV